MTARPEEAQHLVALQSAGELLELLVAGKTENLTNAGKGRKKGVPNRITTEAKQAFAEAFDEMGGVANLVAWARKNPESFYKLYSKLIPVTVGGVGPEGAISIIISEKDSQL